MEFTVTPLQATIVSYFEEEGIQPVLWYLMVVIYLYSELERVRIGLQNGDFGGDFTQACPILVSPDGSNLPK